MEIILTGINVITLVTVYVKVNTRLTNLEVSLRLILSHLKNKK